MYWTLGHYDQVCVFEAPNDETAASVLPSADILGNIRTQTLRAFTSVEMEKILANISVTAALLRSYDRGASRPAVVVC